ncbi:furin-like protease kpc-1 [Symsagittifera roscoffensis]|uniref:furin-like protease kpc-1 n=1 Tax=Symsagittifera roscoffensis TaxID=84072 RepID=UPI00307BA297
MLFEKDSGRGGKGSIFVWAAGNGGRHQDDCNCDGYTTSIYTLSIASTTEHELFPWYSERCSSTLASTYSSGSVGDRSIVTTDLKNKCTDKRTGTSASAPLAAGICALALEANANLTWRDMQHIVLRTARPLAKMQPKGSGDAWTRNGAGRLGSHSYGYGLMDAGAMVRLAKQWSTVPPQRECVNSMPGANPIKIQPHSSQSIRIQSTGCNEQVLYLEHVVVIITLKIPTMRGKLSIQLKSPAGTVSQLLFPRNKDTGKTGFDNWQFMSVHHWEETAVGEWEFVFKNDHAIATGARTNYWCFR